MFYFFIGNHPALIKVDQEHLARLQATLEFNILRLDRQYANFRCHYHAVVVGQIIAAGAQAVTVQSGADITAIGKHN